VTTYAQLSARVDRLAAALAVGAGETVAVVAPNVPALVVGLFAAWRAGAVAVPLSARLRRFELERALADARPAAVVSTESHAGFAVAAELAAICETLAPGPRGRITIDPGGEVVTIWDSRHSNHSPRGGEIPDAPGLADDVAAILYTSGTTGEPKGALVSHALGVQMAWTVAELLGEHAEAPYGLVVPASHAFGLACLLGGVFAGACAVMVDATASLAPLLEALESSDAPVLHGSPALFTRVLRAGLELPLRTGLSAGSLCPPGVLEALEEHGAKVLNLYGMTELGCVSSCRLDDRPEVRHGTVGRALEGFEVRAGAGGEIEVRSRFLPEGYNGRPWSEQELTADGWFRTGDLGSLKDGGNLVIAGRVKEVVHVGGFNVIPAEVESYLLTHPQVAQAAVVGVEHPVLGEALRAFVTPVPGASLRARDVIRFARQGIAGYKVPYAVELVEELPLLASGKVDRRALGSAR
jgi:acyl-CoA synthetase (AMP-forming)/AMP-acid ligase II